MFQCTRTPRSLVTSRSLGGNFMGLMSLLIVLVKKLGGTRPLRHRLHGNHRAILLQVEVVFRMSFGHITKVAIAMIGTTNRMTFGLTFICSLVLVYGAFESVKAKSWLIFVIS